MRSVYFSDLSVAARALLSVPPDHRENLCMQMMWEADWADKYTKRLGKAHLQWGNGTLMAAARTRQLQSERCFSDTEFAMCIGVIIKCLEMHRAAKACKSRLHAHIKIKLHHGFAFG
ncbi:MAG: DUF7742 family protein [Sulfitobacter sp.]